MSPPPPMAQDIESRTSPSTVTSHGLSLFTAALFVVGETAGTGVLALPRAVAGAGGWIGIGLIVFCCWAAGFTGIFLGKSWLLVEHLRPQIREGQKIRDPYPVIGHEAAGPWGSRITTGTLLLQMVGGTICLILLSSQLVWKVLDTYQVSGLHEVTFCEWVLIIGAILIPLSWFGSPVDFWPIAVVAMSSTGIASIIVTVLIATDDRDMDEPNRLYQGQSELPTATSFFLALGTMFFGVGGASGMPTFQMDMKNKSHFTPAVALAFTLMLLIFIPLSVASFYKYGYDVKSNLLLQLPPGAALTVVKVLMTSHVLTAALVVINPVNLLLEDMLKIDHSFNWKRCGLRTLVMIFCTFTALTMPKFDKVLNFVGASAISVQSFVLPPLWYILLSRKVVVLEKSSSENDYQSSLRRKLVLILTQSGIKMPLMVPLLAVMAMGVFVGISATYFSLWDMFSPDTFIPPCYVNECRECVDE